MLRAFDESRGREVALKRLLPQAAQKPHLLRLFEREFQTLASLAHPRIIEVYEYGLHEGVPYYTMELLAGSDLRDLAPRPFREACSDLRDVASSLALLHARRLAHRDVSPRNVRRTADGRAKLIDFGAVAGFGACHEVVGTPPCVAPEVLRGLALDARSDLYALGVVAYYALTGRYPYPARELAQLIEVWQIEPVRPSQIVPGIPPRLDELVMALLSHDPEARPGSAAEVIEKLNAIGELAPESDGRIAKSFLFSPPLVARKSEMQRFERRLRKALNGEGASLFVRGDAGHGRTRLLQAFAVEAQLRGALVLLVDAQEAPGPHGIAGRVIDGLLRAAPELAREVLTPRLPILRHAFPRLLDGFEPAALAELSPDPMERRSRIQEALIAYIHSVAARHPLVLLTDNVDHADEASLNFLASLAFDAKSRPVLLASTLRRHEDSVSADAIKALRRSSDRMTLRALGAVDVALWVKELFANAPNHGRLSSWLHAMTGGSPAGCLELLHHLVDIGIVRYEDGAWVLPTSIEASTFPSSLAQARSARLARLSASARRVLEAAAVWHGELSEELFEHLAESIERDALFPSIAELVAAGFLVPVGEGHRLANDDLRTRIWEEVPIEQKRDLHRRAATFLERGPRDVQLEIEAGWHLLQAGEESRGADVLAAAAMTLASRGDVVHRAIAALEAALEVYDREERPLDQRMEVLVGLMFGALYADHRLADQYGDRFLDHTIRFLGLDLAKSLRPFFGRKMSLVVALGWAAIRHAFRRRKGQRPFADLVVHVVGAVGTLASVSAVRVDPKPLSRLLAATEPLLGFGANRAPTALYHIVERVHATTWNDQELAMKIAHRELEKLRTPEGYPDLLPEHRNQLIGGCLTTLALTLAQCGDPKSLEYADQLEDVRLSFFSLIGLYSRYLFHAYRGESEMLPDLRSRIDYFAVRGGTTWQAELFVPVNLLDPLIASDDVVGLREVTVRLERTARDVDVFRVVARFAQMAYQCARGQVNGSLASYAAVVDELRKEHQTEFLMASAGFARALLRSGEPHRAIEVCERAVRELPNASRRWGLWATELAIQHALAEAAIGDVSSAIARIDAALDEFGPTEHPLRLATLHHARALLALEARDRSAFQTHLAAMERWAKPTGNPALLGQLRMLGQKARWKATASLPPRQRPGGEHTEYRAYLECALATCDSITERDGALLDVLIQKTGALGGFLYLTERDGVRIAASRAESNDPEPALHDKMTRLLTSFTNAPGTDRTETHTVVSEEGETTTGASGIYVPVLLTFRERDQLEIVGLAALRRGTATIEDPPPALVQAIAKALLGSPATADTLTALAES